MTVDGAWWMTAGFIVAVCLLIAGYDIAIYRTWGPGPTITGVLRWTLTRAPWLMLGWCFLLGLWVGHTWLFPRERSDPDDPEREIPA